MNNSTLTEMKNVYSRKVSPKPFYTPSKLDSENSTSNVEKVCDKST